MGTKIVKLKFDAEVRHQIFSKSRKEILDITDYKVCYMFIPIQSDMGSVSLTLDKHKDLKFWSATSKSGAKLPLKTSSKSGAKLPLKTTSKSGAKLPLKRLQSRVHSCRQSFVTVDERALFGGSVLILWRQCFSGCTEYKFIRQ